MPYKDPEEAKRRKREKYQEEREEQIAKVLAYQRGVLAEFFDRYGACCACCGEDNRLFLTIDHMNGRMDDHYYQGRDVNGQRRKKTGIHAARAAKKEGWPDTYQVLCFNCNSGRARNGGVCPHQEGCRWAHTKT